MPKLGMLGASWNWGQSTNLTLKNTDPQQAAQILSVSLPSPAVCSVFLHARYVQGAGPIVAFTANFSVGVGRTTITFSRTVLNQPTSAAPLEILIPQQPITALQLDVTVFANPSQDIMLTIAAELAPITSIHGAENALEFGMALPGEADGLDDDAYEALDEHDPEYADLLREVQNGREDPRVLQEVEHVRRYGRRRPRQDFHAEANQHGRELRKKLHNWNGRNGR